MQDVLRLKNIRCILLQFLSQPDLPILPEHPDYSEWDDWVNIGRWAVSLGLEEVYHDSWILYFKNTSQMTPPFDFATNLTVASGGRICQRPVN